jgi:hypothetical protein
MLMLMLMLPVDLPDGGSPRPYESAVALCALHHLGKG